MNRALFAVLAALALVAGACDGEDRTPPPTAPPSVAPTATATPPPETPSADTSTPAPPTQTPIPGDLEPALRDAVQAYAASLGGSIIGPCLAPDTPAGGTPYCYLTPAATFGERRRVTFGIESTGQTTTLWFGPAGSSGYTLLVAHPNQDHEPGEPCPVEASTCEAALKLWAALLDGDFGRFTPGVPGPDGYPSGDGYDASYRTPDELRATLDEWRLSTAPEREDEHGWGEPRLFAVGCPYTPARCRRGGIAAFSVLTGEGRRRVLVAFLAPDTGTVTETWFVDDITPNLAGLLTGGPTTPGEMFRWAPDYVPPSDPKPTPTPRPEPTPFPTPFGTADEVSGLDPVTETTTADSVVPLGQYESPFEPWDRESTVLYDLEHGTTTNLGTGTLGVFSPDSRFMAWTADWERARVIELATGRRWDLGPAQYVWWQDADTINTDQPSSNRVVSIDVLTGERREGQRPGEQGLLVEGGYRLLRRGGGGVESTNYVVVREDGQRVRYFDALTAVAAGPGEVAVATTPVDGITSIYLMDIESGEVTFVATSSFGEWNWPIAASADYIAWTDAYCGDPAGRTRILNRTTGLITELDATLWVDGFTPDGMLAVGEFGPDALIDPVTGEIKAALPGWTPEHGPADSTWSPNYRYGSLGQFGGHGGLCGA